MSGLDELWTQIGEKREELVDAIRAYSVAQVQIWKQIPLQVREADARGRIMSEDQIAYRSGYLPLPASGDEAGNPTVYVDLDSGRLVQRVAEGREVKNATTGDLLLVASQAPSQFDAQKWLDGFRSAAQRGARVLDVGERIRGLAEKYPVGEHYSRSA